MTISRWVAVLVGVWQFFMTKSRRVAVFCDEKQEGGSFSQHKAVGWQFFTTKSRRVADFHDIKQ